MSLQHAAQHLAHKGRGPDTTLVHMSRDEVKSLNDLAMAHGGQLTINPQTGLPEAGFLSMILPLVAGAALGPAGMGLTAMQAGLLVGAGSYALNPKGGLMGGLSAGLGGYGGAGLGAGLSDLVTSEAGLTAQTAGNEVAQQEVRQTAQQQAQQAMINASPEAAGFATPSALPSADQLATIKSNVVNESLLANPPPTGFDAMKQGAKSLFNDPTGEKFKTVGGGSYSGLARMGLSAAAPALAQPAKFDMPAATSQKSIAPRYKFNPGMVNPTPAASATGVENTYFKPQYTAISDEEAKNIYGFAGGGPIEAMSNANAIGANTGFPQAYDHTHAYATPYQTPISQNVLTGAGDVSVDPYTGEQRMAEGGETSAAPAYTFDPQTQKYTSNAPTGAGAGIGGVPLNYTGAAGAAITDAWNQMHPEAALGMGGGNAFSYSYDPQTQQYTGGNVPTNQIYLGGGQYGLNKAAREAEAAAAAASSDSGNGVSGDSSGMATGGKAKSYRTTLDDSLETAYAKAQEGNDTATMRAIEEEMDIRNTNKAGMEQGLSGMKGLATGGLSNARYNLGGYSDGGRLLRGPGDGVSDSIPAVIGKKQPARLADGEFVVPARIVSELGNGSTEAGARRLYAMMDRIQSARGKTVGKGKVAKNTRADKYLPA